MENFKYVLNEISLRDKFDIELIDNIKVLSLFSDMFESCESLGINEINENGDSVFSCARIGEDFHVEFTPNQTRFLAIEPFLLGSYSKEPSELLLFTHNFYMSYNDTEIKGELILYQIFNPEYIIPKVPSTMLEFARFLEKYMRRIKIDLELRQMDRKVSLSKINEFKTNYYVYK